MTEPTKLTAKDAGCIFDSHRGHQISALVIWYAKEIGRITEPFVQFAVLEYDDKNHVPHYPFEALQDETDSAIEWLNDFAAPDGYHFDWNDGDFGMYKNEPDDG